MCCVADLLNFLINYSILLTFPIKRSVQFQIFRYQQVLMTNPRELPKRALHKNKKNAVEYIRGNTQHKYVHTCKYIIHPYVNTCALSTVQLEYHEILKVLHLHLYA